MGGLFYGFCGKCWGELLKNSSTMLRKTVIFGTRSKQLNCINIPNIIYIDIIFPSAFAEAISASISSIAETDWVGGQRSGEAEFVRQSVKYFSSAQNMEVVLPQTDSISLRFVSFPSASTIMKILLSFRIYPFSKLILKDLPLR